MEGEPSSASETVGNAGRHAPLGDDGVDRYRCRVPGCPHRFPGRPHLFGHLVEAHGWYVCPFCEDATPEARTIHLRRRHGVSTGREMWDEMTRADMADEAAEARLVEVPPPHIDADAPSYTPNWETFRQFQRGRARPQITLYQGTTIMAINEPAYEAIGKPKGVVFLFDRAEGLIGIQPADPAKDREAYLARHVAARIPGVQVSAKAFAKFYGLEPGVYPVTVQDGILVARVSDREPTPKSRRAQSPNKEMPA
jgi:hypothetical protein